MSILRVFPGKIDSPEKLRRKIQYVLSHKPFYKMQCESDEYLIKTYGLPYSKNPAQISEFMLFSHNAFGRKGQRLAYHILMDFAGLLSPTEANIIGFAINQFLAERGLQFVQGVHISKKNCTLYWPHVHTICNTQIVRGRNFGKKFHFYKRDLLDFHNWANCILQKNHLPTIPKKEDYFNDTYY